LRGRRARRVNANPEPQPVATSRATLVDADPLTSPAAAESWLKGADGEALVSETLRVVNRVLHLHRVSTADAAARDVSREQALVARVGYGAGEEVADGRYAAAVELPAPRGRVPREAALRPQERLAALLSGRDAALACEELVLRARSDLAAGRSREAALVLPGALASALSELEPWAERGDLRRRLDELAGLRAEAERAYDRALESGLDEDEAGSVDRVLGRVEAALRARTAGGLE
jgi:hypothetical protein